MLGVITARMTSSRLPGKVLLPLEGKSILEHIVDRVRASGLFEDIVIATGLDPRNAPIIELAARCDVGCFRGEDEDVLDRYVRTLRQWSAEDCVRICADNPLTDMETTARLVALHQEGALDYTCVKGLRLPLGLTEVISRHALQVAHAEAPAGFRRESITIFIRENVARFKVRSIPADPFLHQAPFRLTVDYPEDYELHQILFAELFDGPPISYRRALQFLMDNPDVAALNGHLTQKAGNIYWEKLDAELP